MANSVKGLCETYRDKDLKDCHGFIHDAAVLRAPYSGEFNTMQWVEASAAILKNHPTDGQLAEELELRRHQIVNTLTAHLWVDMLIDRIKKANAPNQPAPSHGNRVQQDRSSSSDDLPSH